MSTRLLIIAALACGAGSAAVRAVPAPIVPPPAEQPPSLDEIAGRMRQVERQLVELSAPKAAATRRALADKMDRLLDHARDGQRKILDGLDRMIEDAERDDDLGCLPTPGSGPPRDIQTPQLHAIESTAPDGPSGPTVLDEARGAGDPWIARLPRRGRETIIAAWKQRFPDKWRMMLERYYAELTRISRGKAALLP